MGKVGREVVKANVDDIINDLNRALAAELHDAYRYLYFSKMVTGMDSLELSEWFAATAQDEWSHMGKIMDRIVQLGGKPITRPSQGEELTYFQYKEPPANMGDLRQIILDSLEGERAAIRFYQALFEKTQHADPVTALLVQEALADEVSDEEELERFLGG